MKEEEDWDGFAVEENGDVNELGWLPKIPEVPNAFDGAEGLGVAKEFAAGAANEVDAGNVPGAVNELVVGNAFGAAKVLGVVKEPVENGVACGTDILPLGCPNTLLGVENAPVAPDGINCDDLLSPNNEPI